MGYAWLPLLKDAQLASQEHNVPVASSLPPNYLSLQEPTSGKVLIRTFMLFKWHRALVFYMGSDLHFYLSESVNGNRASILESSY